MSPLINQEDAQDLPRVSVTGLVDKAVVVANLLDIFVGDSVVKSDSMVVVESCGDDSVAVVNSWLVGTLTFKPAIEKKRRIKHIIMSHLHTGKNINKIFFYGFHNLKHCTENCKK